MSDQCGYEKDDGGTCGTDFGLCPQCGQCFAHCGHRQEARARARQKGAEAKNRKDREGKGLTPSELPPLESHEAAEEWTDAIGRAAATGRLSASAAQAALRAVREWRESREAGQVSDRLEELTDALAEWRRTGSPDPVLDVVEGGES